MSFFVRVFGVAAVWAFGMLPCGAQETFPVNGTVDKRAVRAALLHATVHVTATEVLRDATVLIEDGRIFAVGPHGTVALPEPVVRHDLSGYHLYPAFIDLGSTYGMPAVAPQESRRRGAQDLSDKKGAYGWNEAIRPETAAAADFAPVAEDAEALRKAGIGAVLTHLPDGIARGTGAVVSTASGPAHEVLLRPAAAAHFSFRKGSSSQDYPSALMGAIALLHQTFLDGEWHSAHAEDPARPANLSLDAFERARTLPRFFAVDGWQDVLRVAALGRSVGGPPFVAVGGLDHYQRLDEVKAAGLACVVPLNVPAAFDVSDPYLARLIGLDELKHWELAPENPARVHAAGVRLALTASGLAKPEDLRGAVREAMRHGLSDRAALEALTEVPAALAGVDGVLGSLRPGRWANFIVTDGPVFGEGTTWFETWVQGQAQVMHDRTAPDLRGAYDVVLSGTPVRLEVTGTAVAPKARLRLPGLPVDSAGKVAVTLRREGRTVSLQFPGDSLGFPGTVRMTGEVWMDSRIWEGTAMLSDGKMVGWSALRQTDEPAPTDPAPAPEAALPAKGAVVYPFKPYGRPQRPTQESVWIRNATVWTCDSAGVLQGADVLLHGGRIAAIGRNLNPAAVFGKDIPPLLQIGASGRHVTPGIIDEHSHIAVARGINEGTQASSAEVRIASALDSEDIDIYRQLAGGVTAAQLLHGSANPIGGQSAVIKLRWGAAPEALLFDAAPPFIKFALGENVKQSNWGDDARTRFPQSRMGVEQVYYDHFIRAREYDAAWQAWRAGTPRRGRRAVALVGPPRRDLELEALAEILRGERFITCHSYRQDEINMLMHVADSMGFRVNTFTHILEGYKVADKMAEHGAGGSSFSDWWAYKYEVKDAIPHNGAVLHRQGVVTAFNSDDAEMARRLNQEAAKAVKYGGVSEEEALKFVTINPAILLHVDHRTGSLAVGKDADVVIWSDHPLSMAARADATFVDGIRYFDRAEDAAAREAMVAERARLVRAMAERKGAGERTPSEKVPRHYHCDTLMDENR